MKTDQVKAIVTGGVSGLGFATARRLVDDGARVVMLDINDEKGAEAVSQLGDASSYINTDVRSEDSVSQAVADAAERMGGLNVAVNCAGVIGAARTLGRDGPMPLEFFSNTIQINLVGSFNVAKAAAAVMQGNEPTEQNERGVIINTASVAAYEGQIGQAAYSASKGGIVGMTLPIARELARFGIRMCSIAPGIFWTPMVDGMKPEIQESLSASIPYPSRLGRPEEYADTCCYIINNNYVNGTTIRVDGAVRMAPR